MAGACIRPISKASSCRGKLFDVTGKLTRRLIGALTKGLERLRLRAVPDPRRPSRIKHTLPLLLRTILVGLVAGARSLAETETLSAQLSEATRRKLRLKGRIADTTLRDALLALNAQALRARIHDQIRAAHRRKALAPTELPFGVVSMDGKVTSIKAWDEEYAQKQVTGNTARGLIRTVTSVLMTSRAKVCLDASPIPPETNEDGHFTAALDALVSAYQGLDLFRMVAYDSGACSRANAAAIRDRGLHYLFRLDGKQPTLLAEAARNLGHLENHKAAAMTEDRTGRGCERRYLFITHEIKGYHDWEHLRTVILVRRVIVTENGESTPDDRYYMSSLGHDRLAPGQWLKLARLRWSVENQGHHTFDTAFAEDRHPWITSDPRGMMAVLLLRRLAYNLIALYRAVTQRSDDNRRTPWRALIGALAHAVVTAKSQQLQGLPEPAG